MDRRNAWKEYNEKELADLHELNERYKTFLSECKTERECVKGTIELAKQNGYRDLDEIIAGKETIHPGDRVYRQLMGKTVALFQIGTLPLEEGMNILGAHIDSPRIDIKQNPLYEDVELAYLDTHYYGGIKKYQWVALPLAIHGVVAKKDGSIIDIVIGEKEKDPVLGITDILPHLGQTQAEKKSIQCNRRRRFKYFNWKSSFRKNRKRCCKRTNFTNFKRTIQYRGRRFFVSRIGSCASW